jgi:lysophospholipase L1-like esterase
MTDAQIRSGFKDLISLLKSKGVKRIILRSAASCNFEVTSRNAEKRLAAIKAGKIKPKKGKAPVATRFGDPKFLEAFNAIMLELASADPAVEYFDIYTAMKSLPGKASLFRATDGVHLSQKGHEYVAGVEYSYLSK